ncbi:MAG: BLUF domain-containing protein [Pseudomonadota bacterium]
MLVRLLYASRSKEVISDDVVQTILKSSRQSNSEAGITGVLCVYESGHTYLQVLEGGRDQVNGLYQTICGDERHTDITILHYADIAERRFSGWRMGRVNLSKVNRSTIIRFSESATLDPFALNGDTALRLLEELVATAAIHTESGGH